MSYPHACMMYSNKKLDMLIKVIPLNHRRIKDFSKCHGERWKIDQFLGSVH